MSFVILQRADSDVGCVLAKPCRASAMIPAQTFHAKAPETSLNVPRVNIDPRLTLITNH